MGVPSEYTCMTLVQSDKVKPAIESVLPEEVMQFKCFRPSNEGFLL